MVTVMVRVTVMVKVSQVLWLGSVWSQDWGQTADGVTVCILMVDRKYCVTFLPAFRTEIILGFTK